MAPVKPDLLEDVCPPPIVRAATPLVIPAPAGIHGPDNRPRKPKDHVDQLANTDRYVAPLKADEALALT